VSKNVPNDLVQTRDLLQLTRVEAFVDLCLAVDFHLRLGSVNDDYQSNHCALCEKKIHVIMTDLLDRLITKFCIEAVGDGTHPTDRQEQSFQTMKAYLPQVLEAYAFYLGHICM
jgi:hypothetical protein